MSAEPKLQIKELTDRIVLPSITRYITQENIKLYAEASLDYNPIHIDEDFARNTPLGGTIAHGMLILGYISHMMTVNFGQAWIDGGSLNLRFKTPARPCDTVTISGIVNKVETIENRITAFCGVLCQNQKGETVVSGEATLKTEGS
ncbi:MaoC family dehydratase [Chloroflexota bacterium]